MFNKDIALLLSKEYDSFYLYDEEVIIAATQKLKTCFPNAHFLYSVKTNANAKVVNSVLSQGFGVDAASVNEVKLGIQNGISKSNIQYSAPGKTLQNIKDTLGSAVIIADSLNEIALIQQAAAEKNIVACIGIRINPSFSFSGGNAMPSKFGVDEKQLFDQLPSLQNFSNIRIIGLHIHLRSQELNSDILENYYTNIFALTERFQILSEHPLEFVNMGSGIGIPYSPQDVPLDIALLGSATTTLISKMQARFPVLQVYIETGRYVVGKAGVYFTKVLDKKISCGKCFVILNNTLNGFIRPSLAQLVSYYSKQESPVGSEPLFTSKNAFEVIALTDTNDVETVTLTGNLCTATDVVASDITLPKLKIGDVIAITNAGSYAAVLSPMQFSSQVPPAELFLTKDTQIIQ